MMMYGSLHMLTFGVEKMLNLIGGICGVTKCQKFKQ
jgi:hypothetical protein